LRLLPLVLLCTSAACAAVMQSSPTAAPERVIQHEELVVRGRAQQRQVVERAALSLVANDLQRVARTADSMATAMGGFVESSELRGERGLRMTLRVPAASLGAALDRLGAMGRVTRRTLNRQDVTDQAVDIDARLATLRTLRDRLRAHLSAASAVTDLVAVERELSRVQGEIDVLEARERALDARVALAGIELEVQRPRVLGPLGLILNGVVTLIGKLFVIR
jgi:hypothetical protein